MLVSVSQLVSLSSTLKDLNRRRCEVVLPHQHALPNLKHPLRLQ